MASRTAAANSIEQVAVPPCDFAPRCPGHPASLPPRSVSVRQLSDRPQPSHKCSYLENSARAIIARPSNFRLPVTPKVSL